jgi:hypothetical protein
MRLSKAIEGWILAKSASGLSPDTAQSYRCCGGNLARFLDDKEVEDVTTKDLRRWMVYLKEEYQPQGIRAGQPGYRLSWGSLYAYWRAMKSLFHWAHDDLGIPRVNEIKLPEGQYPVVVPFTEDETRAMLKAAERLTINDKNRKHYTRKTPQSARNVAILTLLLDTGLRVGELERLTVSDVNINTGEIVVKPHGSPIGGEHRQEGGCPESAPTQVPPYLCDPVLAEWWERVRSAEGIWRLWRMISRLLCRLPAQLIGGDCDLKEKRWRVTSAFLLGHDLGRGADCSYVRPCLFVGLRDICTTGKPKTENPRLDWPRLKFALRFFPRTYNNG